MEGVKVKAADFIMFMQLDKESSADL